MSVVPGARADLVRLPLSGRTPIRRRRVGKGKASAPAPLALRRARALALAVLLLVAVAWGLVAGATGSAASAPARADLIVVVQAGDTVWDLVAPHAPAGADPAAYAAAVAARNGVQPSRLIPGTVLRIPQS